ncbi:MAG: PD-(D/E)XK nuclease family protein, partial [Nonlabens ulvanivorans]
MIDYKNLSYTLEEIKLIRLKNEEQLKSKKFNIFSILRNPHEEVGLHSRFLMELLNPKGTHGKKELFLKHFLKVVKHPDFNLQGAQSYCEKHKIDILVQNLNQALVIENKIYAGDQPQQLDRYYNIMLDAGYADIQLYYLTLTGSKPSKSSLGDLPKEIQKNNLRLISYKKDIPAFIDLCIKECATQPELRETLVQYKNLLKQLTMSNHLDTIQQLQSTLNDVDKMKTAHFLVKNWKHIRWHTEWDFWNELKAQAPESVALSEHFEYSAKKLN